MKFEEVVVLRGKQDGIKGISKIYKMLIEDQHDVLKASWETDLEREISTKIWGRGIGIKAFLNVSIRMIINLFGNSI